MYRKFSYTYVSLIQLFIKEKELSHNSFFQHDFVSKLNRGEVKRELRVVSYEFRYTC